MKYFSTRGQVKDISFEDAVLMGLAEDGGLLLPASLPQVTGRDLKHFSELKYERLALEIMSRFISGIPENDLAEIIAKSYSSENFDTPDIIPVVKAGDVKIAELFHGPTLAFKDMALQFLGNLFEYILRKRGRKMNIIGATSGDTGSAAIYGMRGKENVNIFILYPRGRVSHVQERQMATVEDPNVFCISASGSFDDCQNTVKALFNDLEFKKKYELGAINSINWARILAQIVYYFYIYFKSVRRVEDTINIAVPTGNFGNIFAGYAAKRMGLPIRLILASNRNNILTRAVKFGDYSIERVRPTHSPSMDIQVASNFERYLYYLYGESCEKTADAMENLKSEKEIEIKGQSLSQIQRDFIASDATDAEIEATIRLVHNKSDYVIDPHTACAVSAAYKMDLAVPDTVCLATAHPAKFPEFLESALGYRPDAPESIKNLEGKEERSYKLSGDPDEVKDFIISSLKK